MKIVKSRTKRPDGQPYEIMVDDEDYELVARYRWYVQKKNGRPRSVSSEARSAPGRILLWWLLIGKPPKGYVTDHIDGNVLNNTRANLRFVTAAENARNKAAARSYGYSSIYNGVHWHKQCKRWAAHCNQKYVGVFKTEWEAAQAYNEAAKKAFGSSARLNVRQPELEKTPEELEAYLKESRKVVAGWNMEKADRKGRLLLFEHKGLWLEFSCGGIPRAKWRITSTRGLFWKLGLFAAHLWTIKGDRVLRRI